ncbi:carbon-nitrogen hydrolase [Candidatus Nitronereus thalassa]|uniref:Carbon-nitrogen hydrolase n=1 Tax=Candidatus Nitronereus thalassa TaxID=3020898 RepID=A0ABU3K3P4_9BACT|nr:carbon-nitrogen hydrolase [Candidatus Nitronereus thalassa]MDT7041011.1 carbon-nitrogen hydrolase [Candidatus Nitronereus thalassa]
MQPSSKIRVGLVQLACSPGPKDNLDRAVAKIEVAARDGVTLVCLPELFTSQYFCQKEDAALFDLAEPVPGPSTEALSKIAKQYKIVIIVPIFERRTAGIYHNSIVVLDKDGSLVGLYRKMHIPDDPAYYEKFYFTPGDKGFQAISTSVGKVGTLICWDQWYPEAARLTTLQGAEMLFYPTAIGWHPSEKAQEGKAQREAWQTIQRSHAIANGVFVVSVNRIGHEKPNAGADGIEFWGSSFVCDPFGVVLAEASIDKEETLMTEVDLRRVEEVRRNWPFLRDRRVDAYGGITKRFLDQEDPGEC